MSGFEVEVVGLEEMLRKLDPEVLHRALRRFLGKSASRVQELVTKRAPVDTGRLQSSLAVELDPGSPPLWAKVGTDVTAWGLSYPRVLDEAGWTHYRGTPRKGQPTQGWFSETAKGAEGDVQRYRDALQDELGREMGG